MFRSASLFIGTSFTVAVFTIFATSNVDSIVSISPQNTFNAKNFNPHKKPISLLNVPICTQGMQQTWWPEAGTIIVTWPYWLRLWVGAVRHQAITWTNTTCSSIEFCGAHPRPISQKFPRYQFVKWGIYQITSTSLRCHGVTPCQLFPLIDWALPWFLTLNAVYSFTVSLHSPFCLPLGLCNETISGLWNSVEIFTGNMSP